MQRLPNVVVLPLLGGVFALTLSAAAPRVLSQSEPVLSEEARRAGVNARVVLRLTIGADGVAQDIQIAHGAGFGLDEEAIKAVSAWRFAPGTIKGTAVSVQTTIETNFRILSPRHEGQQARLEFSDPATPRPELIQGKIPENPRSGSTSAHLKVALTVGADGKVRDLNVLESNPPEWGDAALPVLRGWKFRSPLASGPPGALPGVFELSVGPAAPSPGRVERSARRMIAIHLTGPQDLSLGPPHLISPVEGATFNIYPRRTEFRWEPVPGAVSYILEWDYGNRGVWTAEEQKTPGTGFAVQSTEFSFDFIGAQLGRWRVWPVNRAGLRGNASEWRTFRHLR